MRILRHHPSKWNLMKQVPSICMPCIPHSFVYHEFYSMGANGALLNTWFVTSSLFCVLNIQANLHTAHSLILYLLIVCMRNCLTKTIELHKPYLWFFFSMCLLCLIWLSITGFHFHISRTILINQHECSNVINVTYWFLRIFWSMTAFWLSSFWPSSKFEHTTLCWILCKMLITNASYKLKP